jgi:hypothetical protein
VLRKDVDPESVEIVYQIEIPNLLPEVAAQLKTATPVFEANNGVNLGKVLQASTHPSTYTIAGEDGISVSKPHPELITLTLTISATANSYGGFYTVSGQPLRIGERISFKTAHFTGIGYCRALSTAQPSDTF